MKNVSIECEFITIEELREKCENGLKDKLTSNWKK